MTSPCAALAALLRQTAGDYMDARDRHEPGSADWHHRNGMVEAMLRAADLAEGWKR